MLKLIHRVNQMLPRGTFAVYKPDGIPCHTIVDQIKENIAIDIQKNISGVKEISSPVKSVLDDIKLEHSKDLSPLGKGILVIGVGEECYLLEALHFGDKQYELRGKFGTATDTYCKNGNIVQNSSYDHITEELFCKHLKKFRGRHYQTAPVNYKLWRKKLSYSDLHEIDGTYYYKDKVFMKPEIVQCLDMEMTEFRPPWFSLAITCRERFSVNSLVHSIGKVLNSSAHITEVEMTRNGPYTINDALPQEKWDLHHINDSIVTYSDIMKEFARVNYIEAPGY